MPGCFHKPVKGKINSVLLLPGVLHASVHPRDLHGLLSRLFCCCQVASVVSDSVWPQRRQAPPSLGFCRQEHWSGLPFPSPMRESEKWSRSVVSDSATPWSAAHQAPPSMGFSRQERWSGAPLPSPLTTLVVYKTAPSQQNIFDYLVQIKPYQLILLHVHTCTHTPLGPFPVLYCIPHSIKW